MKQIFKFLIIFFCIWAGTKSILELRSLEETYLDMVIDLLIFTVFVGVPALSFWNYQIDKAFGIENDDEEEENNNK